MAGDSHYSRARSAALSHADWLIESIKAGKMSASAFESVMEGFLSQPAYCDYRGHLLALCMERLDGKTKPNGSGNS